MARTIEVRLSKDPGQLRIKHYNVIKEPLPEDKSLNTMVNVIHLYTGLIPSHIRTFKLSEIVKMFTTISTQFASMKVRSTPPKEIKLNGTVYELINPKKAGIGWHIDFASCNIDTDPVKLATMFYHPKGILYGQVDENGNMLSTSLDRRNDIEMHMELSTFLEASAFFLKKYEQSMRTYTVKERSKNLMERILKKLRLNRTSLSNGKK